MGHLFPHDRPFVDHIGYNFLHHAADDSFPSDHGTVILPLRWRFVLAPPLVRHRDDGDSHYHRPVARLSRRTLAVRYDWRAAGSDAWLPERTADLAVVRRAALPCAATLLPFLFRVAHSKGWVRD